MNCRHRRQWHIDSRLPCANTKCPAGVQGQAVVTPVPQRRMYERAKIEGEYVWCRMGTDKPASFQTLEAEKYPSKCPKCGAPAYVGLNSTDCSAGC